jgi:nucleoside-diphosphate-sugar epimerase
MSTSTKTFVFFGASGGVGLAALKNTLAASHKCVALLRTPSKLDAVFPAGTQNNLRIVQGNAHDVAAVSTCLRKEDGTLADVVVSTIGGAPTATFGMDDPDVCKKGMITLLEALAQLRRDGVTGSPHIVACSTTGMSKFGREVPLAVVPIYKWMLKAPRADKVVMEDRLVDSGESFTIIRPSMLATSKTGKPVRVGIEDPKKGPEHVEMGYIISKEDTGKWVSEHLVLQTEAQYTNKIVTLSH